MKNYWNGDLFYKVVEFAMKKHNGQTIMLTKMPYIGHVFEVFGECINCCNQEKLDVDYNYLMIVALLHDTLEDTSCTYDEISNTFGQSVANGVLALTKNSKLSYTERLIDSLDRILLEQKEVSLVKLADRIVNLQEKPTEWNLEKLKSYKKDSELILQKLGGVSKILSQRLKEKINTYL